MRMSQLFSQTLREAPADVELESHQLLLRAGYLRPLAAGVFSYLPFGQRVINKIEAILRDEMDAIGGQEVTMPVVHPAELWKKTGRWYKIDAEMGRFKDRNGRDMVLAMTHEEVVAELVSREIRSYRQLPRLIYHIQTKWRDDPRPRAGLIRAREFTMKDSYSLDRDWEGLMLQYQAHYQAYFRIFERCDLPVIAVQSDVGMMGGNLAHEFMFLNPNGEDTLVLCSSCDLAANRQAANFSKPFPEAEPEQELVKVATPGTKTIADLALFLGIPEQRTAKAVFYMATLPAKNVNIPDQQVLIFAIVRGDMEVNETKLVNAVGAKALRPALEEEICLIGAEPGYASPIGLKKSNQKTGTSTVLLVVDDLIPHSPNLTAGANETGYHLMNVNYGRDYTADIVANICAAREGDACPSCGSPLNLVRGIEVGNIFQLGTHFSESIGSNFTDEDGAERPVVMGSYGIGVGRLLACIAEAHHDEKGLIWPVSVAPYLVHLILLPGKAVNENNLSVTLELAEKLYRELSAAGIEVLFDDRNESPGVKFNDADLIGIPLRITVSERAFAQGGVEFKHRDSDIRQIVKLEQVLEQIKTEFALGPIN